MFTLLQEVESRILKALQPRLLLDPAPKLDRLCNNPVPTKVSLFRSTSCSLAGDDWLSLTI